MDVMVDTPPSDASHDSDTGANGAAPGKIPAGKDRECPYCHQRFTSSSLGRHLDQYIFKKRPDGIHNIEEIQQQRGGITRRTPRHGKRDGEGSQPTRTSSMDAAGTPPAVVDLLNGRPAGGIETKFNALTWHSTGVINDLDARRLTGQTPPAPTPTGTKRNWATYETGQREAPDSRGDTGNDRDSVRALELALREVLDSLQAASARAASSTRSLPFDFDIQSQTFPSLCLLLLSPPPTLFCTAPFSTPSSFPLDPPGPGHLDILHVKLQTFILRWKWDALARAQRASYPNPFSTAANLGEEHEYLSRTAQQHEDLATKHLQLAYAQWMAASEEQRSRQWQLELTKAFVGEQEKRKEAEQRAERVAHEAEQLQAQVEMLSRCQWPREMALWPPEREPIGDKVLRELRMELKKHGTEAEGAGSAGEPGRWDFERLVAKWKKVVKEDKHRQTGVLAVHQRPTDTQETLPQRTSSQTAAKQGHGGETQGTRMPGAVKSEEPRRRSVRTHMVTSVGNQDGAVREFSDSSTMNGTGQDEN